MSAPRLPGLVAEGRDWAIQRQLDTFSIGDARQLTREIKKAREEALRVEQIYKIIETQLANALGVTNREVKFVGSDEEDEDDE